MKNFLLKLLCKILPIPKHRHGEQKRFLIVSTTALGDTLWGTPAIESLRKSFPTSYIGVLTSKIGFEVLKTNPHINRLHQLQKQNLFILWKNLYQEKFDTVLIFHTSQRVALPLSSLLGASQIIGSMGINKGLDHLLTHPMPPVYEHEIVRRLRMVEKVGGKIHTEQLSFIPDAGVKAPQLLEGKWIVIHPGSKDGFKRWPAKNFAEVGRSLIEKMGCQILITGTHEEKALMEAVAKEIPGAHLADPSLSLHAFALLLKQADLLISNDTGPIHLASAMNIPSIALFSPTDPFLCGPHKALKTIALQKPPTCTPCLKRRCKLPFCLLQISPTDMIKEINSFLTIF